MKNIYLLGAECDLIALSGTADTFDAPSNVFIMKDPGDCEDFHKDCQNWEKRGECKGNAEVLV